MVWGLLWKRATKGTSVYFAQEILSMDLIGWEKPALKSQSAELCVVLRFIKIAFTTAGASGGLPHFCLKSISRYCVKFPKKRTGWLKVFEKQTWLDYVRGMELSLSLETWRVAAHSEGEAPFPSADHLQESHIQQRLCINLFFRVRDYKESLVAGLCSDADFFDTCNNLEFLCAHLGVPIETYHYCNFTSLAP